jgi:NAD(P)-dependent dehydrogenase (short-subunit alcohol dehydrogenase family)
MDLVELLAQYDFNGRTIVVTGGTGVLCSELARALAGCNAQVALLARNVEAANRLIQTFPPGRGRAIAAHADVLLPETLQNAAAQVVKEFGRVDGLINGAGGNRPQATTSTERSFFDLLPADLRSVFDLNVMGTVLPSQVFGRLMVQQAEGVILNVTSMSAYRPMTRVVGYSAAKAAVSNFTQWLAAHMAQEYSPRIRVNAIAPGFFLTEQNRYLLTDKETGALTPRGQAILAHTPLARFGKPEDLVGPMLWLLSPLSAFVTGVVIPIDGGFSAFSGV